VLQEGSATFRVVVEEVWPRHHKHTVEAALGEVIGGARAALLYSCRPGH